MLPTVLAWLHFTSFVWMSRLGTLSAHAPSPRVRLRFVWNASLCAAFLAMWMRPVYTLRAEPPTAPLKSRSLWVRGASWRCSVRKSCIWLPLAKYSASCWAFAPCSTKRASARTRA